METYKFLGVYQKYEELWDTCNEKYSKKNERQICFKNLIKELTEIGYDIPTEDFLRKKIKNVRDVYRNESNKVKKSLICGTGDVYEPKLRWFKKADSFLKNLKSGRESSSILVRYPAFFRIHLFLSYLTANLCAKIMKMNLHSIDLLPSQCQLTVLTQLDNSVARS